MMNKIKNKQNIFIHLVFVLMTLWIFFPSLGAANLAQLRQIIITDSPLSLRLNVDQNVPVKIIQIDDREILIALKNTRAEKNLRIKGRKKLRDLAVENLDGNVTALVVSTGEKIQKAKSYFDPKNRFLRVAFQEKKKRSGKPPKIFPKRVKKLKPRPSASVVPKQKIDFSPAQTRPYPQVENKDFSKEDVRVATLPVSRPVKKPPARKKEIRKKEIQKAPRSTSKAPPEYVPVRRRRTEFKGNIDDIYRIVERMDCDEEQILETIHLIKKKNFKEAFERIDYYISMDKYTCLEAAHYLRAYAFYRGVLPGDYVGLMEAQEKFQNALVLFPKSDFIPYGLTANGLIQMSMKNVSAAEGYFNVVLQEHSDYLGLPEVQYFLGLIYMDKGYIDKALGYFKKVFESETEHSYIADAGIGYGKTLYEKKQFFNALRIFNYVMKLDMKKIYDSPDLLMCAANSNFELGLTQDSISHYMRAMNLFEDLKDKDILLSKVGDAYGMENKIEKAIKVYELVREKYPETQGYINASMGIARYLTADEEKIQIYTMIKTQFPENTYSRIAMMRLAEIYEKNGEYDRCIKEIEDLLSTHPRGLRYEAVKLMQRAYEELFRDKLEKDAYTHILGRYEQEYVKIDKMGSRQIEFFLGQAYLKAGLWDQSFNHFMNSYKQYKKAQRSPTLLAGLAIAMDESGRDSDALKVFKSYIKRFKKHEGRVDVLRRMGRIYFEKEKFGQAVTHYSQAYSASQSAMERGGILMENAEVEMTRGELNAAAAHRERAVKEFAAAPGKNYEILTAAYKELGNTYVQMKSYVRAADAFSKALDLSKGEGSKANLGFLLGDAYQKGNSLSKAKEVFQQVSDTYDSVWARLAQQRLMTLDLAQTAKNS